MRNNYNWLYLRKPVISKAVRQNSKKRVPVSPNLKRKREPKELIDLRELINPETREEENLL
jgi:hypothetical protein